MQIISNEAYFGVVNNLDKYLYFQKNKKSSVTPYATNVVSGQDKKEQAPKAEYIDIISNSSGIDYSNLANTLYDTHASLDTTPIITNTVKNNAGVQKLVNKMSTTKKSGMMKMADDIFKKYMSWADSNTSISTTTTNTTATTNTTGTTASTSTTATTSTTSTTSATNSGISTEIINLGNELTKLEKEKNELVYNAVSLADLDWNSADIQKYLEEYYEIVNEIAQKETKFDSMVKSANIDTNSAEFKNAFSEHYSEIENKKSTYVSDILSLKKQVQKLQAQYNKLESGSEEADKVYAQKQIAELQLAHTETLLGAYEENILDSSTKTKVMSKDVFNSYNNIMKNTDDRLILAYEMQSTTYLDKDYDFENLMKKDLELEQDNIQNWADFCNAQYTSGYDVESQEFQELFMVANLNSVMYISALTNQLEQIENRQNTIAVQLEQLSQLNPDSEEVETLKSISCVYQMESENLKTQLRLAQEKQNMFTDFKPQDKLITQNQVLQKQQEQKEYNELFQLAFSIDNKMQTIEYQCNALSDLGGFENWQTIRDLKDIYKIYKQEYENVQQQLFAYNK